MGARRGDDVVPDGVCNGGWVGGVGGWWGGEGTTGARGGGVEVGVVEVEAHGGYVLRVG